MPTYQDIGMDTDSGQNPIDYGNPNYDGMGNNGPLVIYPYGGGGSGVNFNDLESPIETNPTSESGSSSTSSGSGSTSNTSGTSSSSTTTESSSSTSTVSESLPTSNSDLPKDITQTSNAPKLAKPINFLNKNRNYIFILVALLATGTGIYYYKSKK